MRLIDKDAVSAKIDKLTEKMAVDNKWRYDPYRDTKADGYWEGTLDAWTIVDDEPTVTEWIPVAERTPEDEGPYLVYGDFPDNGYLIAYAKRILNWKKTNFFIAPFWNSPSEVIHAQAWCKLPSPYRAERSNS